MIFFHFFITIFFTRVPPFLFFFVADSIVSKSEDLLFFLSLKCPTIILHYVNPGFVSQSFIHKSLIAYNDIEKGGYPCKVMNTVT